MKNSLIIEGNLDSAFKHYLLFYAF